MNEFVVTAPGHYQVVSNGVLEFYDEHVGPFAYEKLANVTSPATGGGMEAATAIVYGVTEEDWWRYDATAQPVSIEINQTQTNVGPFDLPLEVGIYMGGSKRLTAIHTIHNHQRLPSLRDPGGR